MDRYLKNVIGPRVVGGMYRSGYWRRNYTVTAIEITDGTAWSMTVQWEDGDTTTHCTAWDRKRDAVLCTPAAS